MIDSNAVESAFEPYIIALSEFDRTSINFFKFLANLFALLNLID